MSPWSIKEFQDFLDEQEIVIKERVTEGFCKQIVNLVFQILRANLHYELEAVGQEMAVQHEES